MNSPNNLLLRLRAAFMKVFFSLLYNRMARIYDLVAAVVSVGMWTHWVESVLPYLNGPYILELGHGPGHLQSALKKQAALQTGELRIFGLDKSGQMGKIARRRLLQQGLNPFLSRGDAQRLPFSDHTFNQVAATFPSEYIFTRETLEEVRRVLVPGGTFVILPVAWITGNKPHHLLAARLFQVTGQAPQWDDRYLKPALSRGFRAQVEQIALQGSEVLVLILTKPETRPNG